MRIVVLKSTTAIMRGVIGRYPSRDEAYVLDFGKPGRRCIHMVGVHRPLLVTWMLDGEKEACEVLEPWTGFACHRGDRVIERRP